LFTGPDPLVAGILDREYPRIGGIGAIQMLAATPGYGLLTSIASRFNDNKRSLAEFNPNCCGNHIF